MISNSPYHAYTTRISLNLFRY